MAPIAAGRLFSPGKMDEETPPLAPRTLLLRALRRRCPRCGRGRIFARFYTENSACGHCGLRFAGRAGNTWAFMYFTTAAFVGPVALAVLVLRASGGPLTDFWAIAVVAAALLLTLPLRKSLALAFDYYIDRASDPPGP